MRPPKAPDGRRHTRAHTTATCSVPDETIRRISFSPTTRFKTTLPPSLPSLETISIPPPRGEAPATLKPFGACPSFRPDVCWECVVRDIRAAPVGTRYGSQLAVVRGVSILQRRCEPSASVRGTGGGSQRIPGGDASSLTIASQKTAELPVAARTLMSPSCVND